MLCSPFGVEKRNSEDEVSSGEASNKLREVMRIDTSKIDLIENVNFADFKKLKIPTDLKGNFNEKLLGGFLLTVAQRISALA